DTTDVRVQAIAHRHVDDPVLAADGDGRLGAIQRQGEEPAPAATAQDDSDYIVHGCLLLPQMSSRTLSLKMVRMIFRRLGSPRAMASAKRRACSGRIFAGKGGVSASTTASTTTGPGVARAWASVVEHAAGSSMVNPVAPQA